MVDSIRDAAETSKIIDKPSIFIGSSSEGLEFARAARSLLNKDAKLTIWNEGFFKPGATFIEALVNSLPRFDFAILILRPDDLIRSRQIETMSPRDNVIFELGLFMGYLGRNRTFILHEVTAGLKLPTDLAGVTTATYEWPDQKNPITFNEAVGAIGAACDTIREVIRDLGISSTRASKHLGQVTQRQDLLESRVCALQIIIKGIVTDYEYEKLKELAHNGPFLVRFHWDMYNELRRLDAIGYLKPQEGYGINSIKIHDGTGNEFDLKQYVRITGEGLEYLKLREELFKT